MLLGYVKVLACVARADGVIAAEELAAINRALDAVITQPDALHDVKVLLDISLPVDCPAILKQCVVQMRDATATSEDMAAHLAELLRDCYVIAAVDGRISSEEVSMIDELLSLSGIPLQKRATLHQWAETSARHVSDGVGLLLDALPNGQ